MTIQSKKLSSFCRTGSGGTPSRSNSKFFENGTIPWVKSGELKNRYITSVEEYITELAVEKSSAKLVSKGSLLIAMYGATVGEVSQLTFDATTNQAICNIAPDENVCDVNYLYRFLEASKPYLLSRRVGGGQPNISQGIIKDLEVPLPSLSEQRRIASILDKADELRQKRQQAIEKLDQLLQATFIEMFGDPVRNPNHVEQVELDKLILVGPQNGLYKPANMYGQGTPIIRIDGFKSGDIVDNKEFKRLTLEQSDIEKYKLNKFDLVINRVNSPEYIGKTTLIRNLEEATVFESNMMRFAIDTSRLDPYYLLFFLKQQFVLNQIANKRKDAVNQSSINQQDVKSLIINIPPIETQLNFSKFFQKLEKNRNLFNKQSYNFDTLFKALQNQAFSGTL